MRQGLCLHGNSAVCSIGQMLPVEPKENEKLPTKSSMLKVLATRPNTERVAQDRVARDWVGSPENSSIIPILHLFFTRSAFVGVEHLETQVPKKVIKSMPKQ